MPTSDKENPPFGAASRPLAEEVLQSAEDAVLTNPASVDTVGRKPEQMANPASYAEDIAGTRSAGVGKLAQQVAEKPVLFVLLAVAAGAVATALVKSSLQRTRR